MVLWPLLPPPPPPPGTFGAMGLGLEELLGMMTVSAFELLLVLPLPPLPLLLLFMIMLVRERQSSTLSERQTPTDGRTD